MSDRISLNAMNSDQLDALYERLARAERHADPELHARLTAAITALGKSETENAELRARVATLEHVAAGNKRHVQLIVPELEQAEAAIARVRAAVHIADAVDVTDWQRGYRACANRVTTALDNREPAPVVGGRG